MSWTTKTGTTPRVVRLRDGHEVTVAYRAPSNPGVLWIELLLNFAGHYGTVTCHGEIYKSSRLELMNHLKFVFDVNEILIIRTTLVD